MAKYVISGYIGFDNFGDEAIAGVLTNHLKEIGAEKITVISLNPNKTSKLYGVDSVPMLNFVKPIITSDILISGGGSLLQDITSLKSLVYYLTVIMTAIIFRKKVVIFAQGFSKFRTKIGEILTKFVLGLCNQITVRDKSSQDYLKTLGLNSELVTDPVFDLEIQSTNHNGIGIQLRSFKGLSDEFLESLAEEISAKFNDKTIKLFSLQDNIDLETIIKFGKLLSAKGCILKLYKNLTVPEAVHEISELEYFIGMRFHACLIATKSGVKTLGINYDEKVKNLSENIGFPVINMYGCEVNSGISKLLEQNPDTYNIPKFTFPNIA